MMTLASTSTDAPGPLRHKRSRGETVRELLDPVTTKVDGSLYMRGGHRVPSQDVEQLVCEIETVSSRNFPARDQHHVEFQEAARRARNPSVGVHHDTSILIRLAPVLQYHTGDMTARETHVAGGHRGYPDPRGRRPHLLHSLQRGHGPEPGHRRRALAFRRRHRAPPVPANPVRLPRRHPSAMPMRPGHAPTARSPRASPATGRFCADTGSSNGADIDGGGCAARRTRVAFDQPSKN